MSWPDELASSILASRCILCFTGSIRPSGWLKSQLRAQADGLAGHLALFWADIEKSAWVGGGADREYRQVISR